VRTQGQAGNAQKQLALQNRRDWKKRQIDEEVKDWAARYSSSRLNWIWSKKEADSTKALAEYGRRRDRVRAKTMEVFVNETSSMGFIKSGRRHIICQWPHPSRQIAVRRGSRGQACAPEFPLQMPPDD